MNKKQFDFWKILSWILLSLDVLFFVYFFAKIVLVVTKNAIFDNILLGISMVFAIINLSYLTCLIVLKICHRKK